MQYRIDPKSGNKLSALGFGCMRFPRGINIDLAKSEKLVVEAVEQGINYFDTAYVYGGSEDTLGKIINKNILRSKIYLATKLPHGKCKTYEDFDRIFNEQLGRLHTDYIDYYLIHNISDSAAWERVVALGIEKWIADKKTSGAVRQIGFSFHGPQAEFMKTLNAYDWEFCQIQYNYMNENYQAGRKGLKAAHAKGLPVIIMEPLLGGKLANGVPKKGVSFMQEVNSETPAAWGLKWLWNQPEVTVVLSGMNAPEQLADNLKSAETSTVDSMTDKEQAVIQKVRTIFEESYKVPCTGCNYCMPCPANVNIPGCFAAYNASYANGFITGMTQYLTSTNALHKLSSGSSANCKKCGLCEKKCPQNIKISEELVMVKKKMEPFWFGPVIKIASRD